MKVEETLQAMYDHYPTLYKTRADCYNQLFCETNSEYAWIDGELLNIEEELNYSNALKNGMAFQYNKMTLQDEKRYFYQEALHNVQIASVITCEEKTAYIDKKEKEIKDIPENAYYEYPRKYRWAFAVEKNKDANIFNVPDYVRGDWRAAIEECKLMLEQDGYNLTEPSGLTETPTDTLETIERNNQEKEAHRGFYEN